MHHHHAQSRRLAGILCAIILLGAAFNARAEEIDYGKLLESKSPSIVTVKFLLKMSMGDQGQESQTEAPGVMIDAKGIVLCSNTQLGGIMGAITRLMGSSARSMMGEMTAVPSELKVLIGEDSEGLEATLIARDSDLDLAWVQIKEPGDRKFDSIDLTKSATPKVGDPLIIVQRMGKYFDRIATFNETRLTGMAHKPRELYVPTSLNGGFGMPVYTAGGDPVGVVILQIPESDEEDDGNPLGMFGSMMNMQGAMNALILPASEVVKATKRALEEGAKPASEAKPEKDAVPADAEVKEEKK